MTHETSGAIENQMMKTAGDRVPVSRLPTHAPSESKEHDEVEYFDVYDTSRSPVGKVLPRGTPLKEGECRLVVYAWIVRGDGKILLTKRAPGKVFEGKWECTGGSVVAGEESFDAALREVREETGLVVSREKGTLIYSELQGQVFVDVFVFHHDFDEADICLRPRETCDCKIVSFDMVRRMRADGELLPYYEPFFGRLDEVLGKLD